MIAVLGGYGVGITVRLAHVPAPGETVLGSSLTYEHGGKGSNQAIAMARWGAQVELITAVGDDTAGSAAAELWLGEGVGASGVRTVAAATMAGVILVDDTGENRIAIAPGALAELRPTDMDAIAHVIRAADALVISLEIPLDTARRALEIAHGAAVTVILNPAPASDVPVDLWASADVLIPNQSEARRLIGGEALGNAELARALHERTGNPVVLTCGAEGAVIADATGVRAVAGAPADVVDTTGAGDSFVGTFTVEYLERGSLDEAARVACDAAAQTVGARGVVPGLPRRASHDRPVAGAQR